MLPQRLQVAVREAGLQHTIPSPSTLKTLKHALLQHYIHGAQLDRLSTQQARQMCIEAGLEPHQYAQATELRDQLVAHCYGIIDGTDNASIINPIADDVDGDRSGTNISTRAAAQSRWRRAGAVAAIVGMTGGTRHAPQLSAAAATPAKQRHRHRLASVMADHKHRAAAHVQLTAAEMASIEEAFEIFDTDGSGAFDMDELEVAIRALGIEVSPEEMQQVFAAIDADGSGTVDKEEYTTAFAICKSAKLGHGHTVPTDTKDTGISRNVYSTGTTGPTVGTQFDI
eukprot:COSAG03_NODE_1387_length_4188_cov_2.499389_2_plen_284_part_00